MSDDFKNNHYVPSWYQKRFIPRQQVDQELFYLDLKPGFLVDPRGIAHVRQNVRKQGFSRCFAERDLYTTRLGADESKHIEKHFFGKIDNIGSQAIDFFDSFSHQSFDGEAFQNLVLYMSTQKLRSIKGLEWLATQFGARNKNSVLSLMIHFRTLYCAVWTECVWLIADASKSNTKFIVSDHPVTVYNRRCHPDSRWCKGSNDPDIRYHATQTLFPLSLEKVLILTNLSWVRNPYQSEIGVRPNPKMFRDTMFSFLDIQIMRALSEQEVREINFIIKARARRFIAAARKDWLHPEHHVLRSDWSNFGHGYLLMPDPRGMTLGGDIFVSYDDGSSTGFDPYGRRPWETGFASDSASDAKTFFSFQGEFARLFGPYRRGRAFTFDHLDKERDDEEFHKYHLGLEKRKSAN